MRCVSLNVIGKFFTALIISVNHFALRFKTLRASLKKSSLCARKFFLPRYKIPVPSEKSINKTYICKNKTNIYINKTIICTNITFIYTFQRGAVNSLARQWHFLTPVKSDMPKWCRILF